MPLGIIDQPLEFRVEPLTLGLKQLRRSGGLRRGRRRRFGRESKLLESELAGPDASPMVRVLANQAAIALLMLRKAEIAVGPGTIDATSVFAAKLAESAQRQLLNTLRSIVMIQIALATARADTPPAALE